MEKQGGAPYLATNYTWSKRREEEEIKTKVRLSIPAKNTQDAPLRERSRDGHGFTWRFSGNNMSNRKKKEKKKGLLERLLEEPTFSTHFKRYSCSSPARGQGEVSCIVIVFVRMNMQDRGKASSKPVRQVNADRARQPTINIWLKPSGGWGTQRGLWSPSGLQKQGRWHYFCLRTSMLDCHVKLFVAYASC